MYLHLPDLNQSFIVQTDASNYAISGWISQIDGDKLNIIGCVSRTLKRAEINYNMTEKELLAIIFTLRKFRQFLLFRKFKIKTDNKALCFLKKTTYASQRINRWIMELQSYDFTIIHCPEARNTWGKMH